MSNSGTTSSSTNGNWYVITTNGSSVDFEIYVDEMFEIRRKIAEKHYEVIEKASKQFRP